MHADYTGQGFDQLQDVISKIKENPDDRRIILSAWNPSDLKLMALPPCHMFAQVIVTTVFKCLYFIQSFLCFNNIFSFYSVLCSKWRVILSDVPALCWYGSWRAIQYCILCAFNMHDCSCLWYVLGTNWLAFYCFNCCYSCQLLCAKCKLCTMMF